MPIRFEKMHGLGNDFVILDERRSPMQLVGEQQRSQEVRAICARQTGVGCDQLIVMRPSVRADVYMQIFNADGGEVAACGNATRCVAWLLMREGRKDAVLVETEAGMLECHLAGREQVRVNMGLPRWRWKDIPLSHEADTLHLDLKLGKAAAVNIGNPHIVFFVPDISAVPLAERGPTLEHDPLFPQQVNVTVAEMRDRQNVKIRTWERGVGETMACCTAACATAVAARRRGIAEPELTVTTAGGALTIRWNGSENDADQPVWMTGPVSHVYSGELKEEMWA